MLSIEVASSSRPTAVLTSSGGERLLDVCDEASAPIFYSCRSGRCAACLVEVHSGSELLEPPDTDEQETLAEQKGAQNELPLRLACQIKLTSGSGIVRLMALRP